MKNNIFVGYDLQKVFAALLGGLVLVVFCGLGAFLDLRYYIDNPMLDNDVIYYLLKGGFIFSLIFLGFGVLYIFRNLICYRKRIIELAEDHMINRSSYTCGGKIYYNDIESVYITGVFLCVKLIDDNAYLQKQNVLKRFLIVPNKKLRCEYINISGQLLDTELLQLKEYIEERIK